MIKIKIASRASNLALLQVEEAMHCFPDVGYTVQKLLSLGDKNKTVSLMSDIPSDFFTRELDHALLNDEADLAIHSAKDLSYPLNDSLVIATLLPALDQSDALVSNSGLDLESLPSDSIIGTSSITRKQEILSRRPDLKIVSIRGTIEERLLQMDNKRYDAVIIATCALIRLGLQHRITQKLDFATHPLQGHLALVVKKNNTELIDLLSANDCRLNWGSVTIAGFGPGNPDLLTIKASKKLADADIIFYDDLLDASYLDGYRAEKIYVGKRSSNHSFSQEAINTQLWQAALDGKNVVRIKGGDPLIFGRGIEEYHFLASRLVKTEIVPGISSALAAATDALVPLTARGISSSVVFLSGHDISKIIIPKAETVVFFMGASKQKELAEKMIEEGWARNIPVAVIQNASYAHSVTRRHTLESLLNADNTMESPLIIIVGWTASRNNELPKRWLYTGSSIKDFSENGMVIHAPLINVGPRDPDVNEKLTLDNLRSFHRIIFTSRYSVEHFFRWLFDAGKDVRDILHLQIDSIGETTSSALRNKGLNIRPRSTDESSEGMLKYYRDHKISGKKILLPRSDKGLEVLPEGLKQLKNKVSILVVYQNEQPVNIVKHNLDDFHGVVFSAPSTVSRFKEIYGAFPEHLKYVFRGAQTEKRFLELNQ